MSDNRIEHKQTPTPTLDDQIDIFLRSVDSNPKYTDSRLKAQEEVGILSYVAPGFGKSDISQDSLGKYYQQNDASVQARGLPLHKFAPDYNFSNGRASIIEASKSGNNDGLTEADLKLAEYLSKFGDQSSIEVLKNRASKSGGITLRR